MSVQIHADFLRLLWVLADEQMWSYYESMGKEDKIGNEAFRWARAKVFNSNKTSVGRAIVFGCATRCHLSVHSLAMPRSGLPNPSSPPTPASKGNGPGGGVGRGVGDGGRGGEGGAASWGEGALDAGCVNAFLAAALSRVMRAAVPIPAVAAASVLHFAAVGGFVAGDVGPL